MQIPFSEFLKTYGSVDACEWDVIFGPGTSEPRTEHTMLIKTNPVGAQVYDDRQKLVRLKSNLNDGYTNGHITENVPLKKSRMFLARKPGFKPKTFEFKYGVDEVEIALDPDQPVQKN